MNNNPLKPQVVLVCGKKNSGKTQYLQSIQARAKARGRPIGGFLSLAQIEDGIKKRYYLHNIHTGEQRLLARRSQNTANLKIGQYAFEPATFVWGEQFVLEQLHFPVLILDEFGPLEMQKNGWYNLLLFLLNHYSGILFISVRPTLLPSLLQLIKADRYAKS